FITHFLFHVIIHNLLSHSFPTRRSSDLALGKEHGDIRVPEPGLSHQVDGGVDLRSGLVEPEDGRVPGTHLFDHQLVIDVAAAGEDRKSTRLNSSHGSISYAVFCLKKKTI